MTHKTFRLPVQKLGSKADKAIRRRLWWANQKRKFASVFAPSKGRNIAMSFGMMALVAFAGIGGQNYVYTSDSITPNDAKLYTLKRNIEKKKLAGITDPVLRSEFFLGLSNKRIGEAKAEVNPQSWNLLAQTASAQAVPNTQPLPKVKSWNIKGQDTVSQLIGESQKLLAQSIAEAQKVSDDTKKKTLIDEISAVAVQQTKELETLRPQVDREAQKTILTVEKAHKENVKQLMDWENSILAMMEAEGDEPFEEGVFADEMPVAIEIPTENGFDIIFIDFDDEFEPEYLPMDIWYDGDFDDHDEDHDEEGGFFEFLPEIELPEFFGGEEHDHMEEFEDIDFDEWYNEPQHEDWNDFDDEEWPWDEDPQEDIIFIEDLGEIPFIDEQQLKQLEQEFGGDFLIEELPEELIDELEDREDAFDDIVEEWEDERGEYGMPGEDEWFIDDLPEDFGPEANTEWDHLDAELEIPSEDEMHPPALPLEDEWWIENGWEGPLDEFMIDPEENKEYEKDFVDDEFIDEEPFEEDLHWDEESELEIPLEDEIYPYDPLEDKWLDVFDEAE